MLEKVTLLLNCRALKSKHKVHAAYKASKPEMKPCLNLPAKWPGHPAEAL